MVDLHCHLIYGIDDGCIEIDESISLIASASKHGYTSLVLTPHYIEDSKYTSEVEKNEKLVSILQSKCHELGIDISLYLGNEVYYSKNILKLLKEKKIHTLNSSRYVLMEFSRIQEDKNILDTIDMLVLNGLTPIIAHPERYSYLMKDLNKVREMLNHGALFQVNMGSILGLYGSEVKKNVMKLLKNHMVQFVSSDTHRSDIYSRIEEVKEILDDMDEEYREKLLSINPNKVLLNEEINLEIIKVKQGLFHR